MAEVTFDPVLSAQQLRVKIVQQQAVIDGQRLEILEQARRRDQCLRNIAASQSAKAEAEAQLAALFAEHGEITEALVAERIGG